MNYLIKFCRTLFNTAVKNMDFEIIAIDDPFDALSVSHLLVYDSMLGKWTYVSN